MKLSMVCTAHACELIGEPFLSAADDGKWAVDLSDMWCPSNPNPGSVEGSEYTCKWSVESV